MTSWIIRRLALLVVLLIVPSCGSAEKAPNRTAQIFAQSGIISEGHSLAEQGRYEEAIQKFGQALRPEYISKESDKASPHFYISRVYKLMGQYQKALDEHEIALSYGTTKTSETLQELQTLVQYQSTGDKTVVLDYLDKYLASRKWPIEHDTTAQSVVIRLYDVVGEYDKGIEFVDWILNDGYSEEFQGVERPSTAAEAERLMNAKESNGLSGPNWHTYKWTLDYLRIREAFELDKKEGTRGRATRALLKSDRLPW